MKSGLEIRPVFVRKKSRTMGHVLVVMLALIPERELEKRLSKTPMEVPHAIAPINGWGIIRQSLGSIRISQLAHPNQIQFEILEAKRRQTTSLVSRSQTRYRQNSR